jgi:hypothetical protein
MSSVFPNLSKIPKKVSDSLKRRAGNNLTVSSLLCWIRVASAASSRGDGSNSSGGLVLESFQNKKDPANSENPEKNWSTDTFGSRYGTGDKNKSGRIGTDFQGNSVYANNETRYHRPSPVIEGLDVQNGQQGLSRKCKFTIKCSTLAQAEVISMYFLEPGFNVLVEFGWNTALGKSGKEPVLDACNIAKHNNFKYCNNKRKNSEGHYDCFLGTITAGGITSGDSETYNIDVELTTIGEIPSYLQQHRGDSAVGDTVTKGDKLFELSNIEKEIDAGQIGRGLFKQMFNRLPGSKQTNNVKNLINQPDYMNVPFSSAHNFLNMDSELREKLVERYQDVGLMTGDEVDSDGNKLEAKIPEGAPLFSDQSFIRLELAFKILNTCRYDLTQESAKSKCKLVEKGFSSEIDINSTICRAFPYMFSTDPSILFVPNRESPEFGLLEALSSTTELKDFVGIESGVLKGKQTNLNLAERYPELIEKKQVDPLDYSFPASTALSADKTFETLDERGIDSDILEKDAGKGYWGYLRNLYINFDFFCDVISSSNVVTKDIYLEILNGISSAANSYWYFEIVNLCDPTTKQGAERLTIRDLSFIGEVKPDKLAGIDKFYTKGIKTPFITSQLTVDIPAAMKNHVIGKRISENNDLIQEEKQPELGELFSNMPDPVIKILSDFKPVTKEDSVYVDNVPDDDRIDKLVKSVKSAGNWAQRQAAAAAKAIEDSATAVYDYTMDTDENNNRSKNYELFIGKAAVYPFLNNREEIPVASTGYADAFRSISEGTEAIQNIAFVGAWKSPSMFRTLDGGCKDGNGKKENSNPILLPIKFTFEIQGLSGIRVGDLFKLIDVPVQYTKGTFQVVETAHSIDGNQWKTTVNAQFRNTSE